MRALLLLALVAAMVAAGCTSPPPPTPGGGNTTTNPGSGSNAYGNGTVNGTPPASPPNPSAGTGSSSTTYTNPGNPIVTWTVSNGTFSTTFKAELFLDRAPITAGNFLNLTRSGYYDGTRFHRVIANFMLQDGDPNTKDPAQQASWGRGGPACNLNPSYPCRGGQYSIPDEFPCKDGTVSYEHADARGVAPCTGRQGLFFTHNGPGLLSMANAGPNSGGSQYFVTVAATPHLDGKHAIFGRIIEGYANVETLSKVRTTGRPLDRPLQDIVISSLRVDGA